VAWSKISKAPLVKSTKRVSPDGLWQKCEHCHEISYRQDFEANQFTCIKCLHHYSIPPLHRLRHFLDSESFQEFDANLFSRDPLGFKDAKPYSLRLEEAREKTGNCDAIVCGEGLLHTRPIQVGVYDFRFMGGSMGSVVGEKISRVFLRAREKKQAAVLFSASGGARMQEGIVSLMQMAKTCSALGLLREEGLPFISVMTNPTTGGVAASYAMLGDINIGEPGALIGFAGPRVIKQTIGQNLPEGFQTSEYLYSHGMLDLICPRNQLRDKIAQILTILLGPP
jgi:acetyl-CoA carboxylase carboxyl transferase subunit beta